MRDAETPSMAAPGARRRSGPRPGTTESRQRILGVAGAAFAANGYAGTSLRGIARDAGVDPSLIVHFFTSKAGLFAATVESSFADRRLVDGIAEVGPDRVGAYVAGVFLANWEHDDGPSPLISFISAALADTTAAGLLRDFIITHLSLPMMERLGVDQPELRAALLSSQLMGLGLGRYALAFDALRNAPTEQLTAWLAETLQRTCTGPLPPAVAPGPRA